MSCQLKNSLGFAKLYFRESGSWEKFVAFDDDDDDEGYGDAVAAGGELWSLWGSAFRERKFDDTFIWPKCTVAIANKHF